MKKVARYLLNRLKQLLVLNWRQKSTARSQLNLTIEDVLDTGLPRAYDTTALRTKVFRPFRSHLRRLPGPGHEHLRCSGMIAIYERQFEFRVDRSSLLSVSFDDVDYAGASSSTSAVRSFVSPSA